MKVKELHTLTWVFLRNILSKEAHHKTIHLADLICIISKTGKLKQHMIGDKTINKKRIMQHEIQDRCYLQEKERLFYKEKAGWHQRRIHGGYVYDPVKAEFLKPRGW